MKMLRKLEDFGELSAAEHKIVDELDSGKAIELYDGLPPDVPDEAYDVRAVFIRYLALGGCDACCLHEKGLRIAGARITGTLDLEGGEVPRDLRLFDCRFEGAVNFRSAKVQNLFLTGSFLPNGLDAIQMEVKGTVLLADVVVHGLVDLRGVKLGGNLNCIGAKFNAAKDRGGAQGGIALGADRLEAKGSIFFRRVEAHGEVRLLGVTLGGDLDCAGAKFNAPKGNTSSQSTYAFSADRLEAKGSFFLCSGAKVNGQISLDSVRVRTLIDEPSCWPEDIGGMVLDQFCYSAIAGVNTSVDAKSRLIWLNKVHHCYEFHSQPYEHLAKVLSEMGHREDARVVMIEKERLQRAAANPPLWRRVWNWVMRKTAGYGYRPSLSLWYLAIFIFTGTYIFGAADYVGAVKPNSARVWHLDEWKACTGKEFSQSACYLASEKGQSYPAFNPLIYSIDTFLPIVDLEMQGAWIPDDRAGWWGMGVRAYMWLHIALGWFFSLLAVAGFSGLIKPE